MGRSIAGAIFVVAILCVTSLSCITMPAFGQLFPTSFGFPNAVQTSTSTAWAQDTANSLNFQDSSIDFTTGFPCIHETSLQTQSMSHTEFSQTTSFAAIGYPFVSVGPGPFGGFTVGC
jgi:hypothetical protein